MYVPHITKDNLAETQKVGLSRTAKRNSLRNGCGVLSGKEHLNGSGR